MKTRSALLSLVLGLSLATLFFVAVHAAPLLVPGDPVIHPAANALNAPTGSSVAITYDEAIDPNTVSSETFAVHGMQTAQRLGVFTVVSGAITLTPDRPFMPGELVQVSATTGTLSLADGQGPAAPTLWQFFIAVGGGTGFFRYGQDLGVPGNLDSLNVALGDLDGDGDLDAFVGTCKDDIVWLNDGSGVFSNSGQNLGGDLCSTGLKLGDLDGDGDLDAVVITSGPLHFANVWFNPGNGFFIDSGQNFGDAQNENLALGDLDGDGDLDIFLAADGPNKVLLNDGAGAFLDSGQSLGSATSTDVALGDLDGDGDLDAMVANNRLSGQANLVWLNDGAGLFTVSGQFIGLGATNAVALGDLDGDGDLDAFFAETRTQGSTTAPNQVWLNDGSGAFTDSGQALGIASSNGVTLGDLDGDGDLDAMIANLLAPGEVWLNNGAGIFIRNQGSVGSLSSTETPLGDLDGDGDLDAFMVHFFEQPDRVWFNLEVIFLTYLPFAYR